MSISTTHHVAPDKKKEKKKQERRLEEGELEPGIFEKPNGAGARMRRRWGPCPLITARTDPRVGPAREALGMTGREAGGEGAATGLCRWASLKDG